MAKKFNPVAVYDAMGFVRQLWLACEAKGEEVTLLVGDTTRFDVFTREVLIGQIGSVGGRTRLIISEKDPLVLAERYKAQALKYGATPEAIRLIGLMTPLSKEELNTMAANKLAPKKGNAKALKEAAAEAPVGGAAKAAKNAEAPKKKGNMEALAKAREAADTKRNELAAQNIKVLVKPGDTTLRGGRLAKLTHVYNAKPKKVGDVLGNTFEHEGKEIVIDAGALRGMEKREHISIG